MQVHNPTNQSRYCAGLGRNIEPYEVVDVPDDFEVCDCCKCVSDAVAPEPEVTADTDEE